MISDVTPQNQRGRAYGFHRALDHTGAILFVLYTIPFTLAEGAERAWIADLVPAAVRGKSFGIYYLANGLCVLVGTAISV